MLYIYICKFTKNEPFIKETFDFYTENYRKNFSFVYTDASKDKNELGYGLSIPNIKYKFSCRLPKQLNISKAENSNLSGDQNNYQ